VARRRGSPSRIRLDPADLDLDPTELVEQRQLEVELGAAAFRPRVVGRIQDLPVDEDLPDAREAPTRQREVLGFSSR